MKFLRMIRWGLHLALLALLAGRALADSGVVTPGGALKKRAYQTYAAATYYVDPTGSDSNACTSSGSSACLTVAGVLAKIPSGLRNAVTVNLAAGTYTMVSTFDRFWTDSSGTLTFTGVMANVTPATGSATGTLTSSVTSTDAALMTMTDSAQTWTVNDLRGRFVRMTSGASSGTRKLIVSNTATQLTLAGAMTVGLDTYALESPAVTLSGATTLLTSMERQLTLTFTLVDFSVASASTTLTTRSPSVQLTSSRVLNSSTGGALVSYGGVQLNGVYVAITSSSTASAAGAFFGGNTQISTAASFNGPNATVFFSAATGATSAVYVAPGARVGQATGAAIAPGTTSAVVTVEGLYGGLGLQSLTNNPLAVFCTTAAGSSGLRIQNGGGYGNRATVVSGCDTGVSVYGAGSTFGQRFGNSGNILSVTGSSGATSTGVAVLQGGAVQNFTPTFSTTLQNYLLESTAYSDAFITGLTPTTITSGSGSAIRR